MLLFRWLFLLFYVYQNIGPSYAHLLEKEVTTDIGRGRVITNSRGGDHTPSLTQGVNTNQTGSSNITPPNTNQRTHTRSTTTSRRTNQDNNTSNNITPPNTNQRNNTRSTSSRRTNQDNINLRRNTESFQQGVHSYVNEIQTHTGYRIQEQQRTLLANDVRQNNYSQKLSTREEKRQHRRAFDNRKDRLIEEWQNQTNQQWPRYDNNPPPGRRPNDRYDAHEIIPNSHGGPIEWWNITPAHRRDHQMIHRRDGAFRTLMDYIRRN